MKDVTLFYKKAKQVLQVLHFLRAKKEGIPLNINFL